MAVKRKSLSEIESLTPKDIGKMDLATLKRYTADASRLANQRIDRLKKSPYGEFSRAYQSQVETKGKRYGVTGKKTKTQLRNELKSAQAFLKMKTSTVAGTKEVRKKVNERLGFEFSSIDNEREFWKAYRKLEEMGSVQGVENGSEVAQKELYKAMKSRLSSEDLVYEISHKTNQMYEEEVPEDETEYYNIPDEFY